MSKIARVFPAFTVGAAFVYMMSMYLHPKLTLFTYVPRTNQWMWGEQGAAELGRNAPGMYWYSWLTTGLIGGIVLGLIALAFNEDLRKKVWSGWVWLAPVALTIFLTWVEWPWFRAAFQRMVS
jgi:hypothetical protein